MRKSSQAPDPAQLNRTVRQLSSLVESSLKLNSTLDPHQMLSDTVDTAAKVLDCEAASILLYDEKRDGLFLAAATNAGPIEPAQYPVPLDASIAGTIYSVEKSGCTASPLGPPD